MYTVKDKIAEEVGQIPVDFYVESPELAMECINLAEKMIRVFYSLGDVALRNKILLQLLTSIGVIETEVNGMDFDVEDPEDKEACAKCRAEERVYFERLRLKYNLPVEVLAA